MKNSRVQKKQTQAKKISVSPEHLGLLVLFLCGLLLWAAYFGFSGGWRVKEPAQQNAILERAQEAEAIDKTMRGAHIPPITQAFYHYSERLEEQTALLISLTLTALHENLVYHRHPQNLPTLINQARLRKFSEQQRLWLPAWDKSAEINKDSGWIKTDRSLHYIHYRSKPFGIEIMTVSLIGDPQITVVRVPEKQGSAVIVNPQFAPESVAGAALYVSPTTNAKLLPPWSPTPNFEQWGWRREPLKLSVSSPERKAEINAWVAERVNKN